jgi:dTMP kinase
VLIVIEGLDGAGKRTLAEGLRTAFEAAGNTVATLAFPRYGRSVHADVAAEALHGEHGDLADSVYAMAMLFALDRAGATEQIDALRRSHDVLILDRYVASNAAYSAARLHQDDSGQVVDWVYRLEFGRFALPKPDSQLLLDVSVATAAAEDGRQRDAYERDSGLQQRTGDVYAQLAAAGWAGRWLTLGPHSVARDVADALIAG